MNKHEINEMAEAALSAYEETAQWPEAYGAARKHAEEVLEAKPDSAQIFAAVTIAKSIWHGKPPFAKMETEGEE